MDLSNYSCKLRVSRKWFVWSLLSNKARRAVSTYCRPLHSCVHSLTDHEMIMKGKKKRIHGKKTLFLLLLLLLLLLPATADQSHWTFDISFCCPFDGCNSVLCAAPATSIVRALLFCGRARLRCNDRNLLLLHALAASWKEGLPLFAARIVQ